MKNTTHTGKIYINIKVGYWAVQNKPRQMPSRLCLPWPPDLLNLPPPGYALGHKKSGPRAQMAGSPPENHNVHPGEAPSSPSYSGRHSRVWLVPERSSAPLSNLRPRGRRASCHRPNLPLPQWPPWKKKSLLLILGSDPSCPRVKGFATYGTLSILVFLVASKHDTVSQRTRVMTPPKGPTVDPCTTFWISNNKNSPFCSQREDSATQPTWASWFALLLCTSPHLAPLLTEAEGPSTWQCQWGVPRPNGTHALCFSTWRRVLQHLGSAQSLAMRTGVEEMHGGLLRKSAAGKAVSNRVHLFWFLSSWLKRS